MVFIDGVGIGSSDPDKNPFFRYGFRTFEKIFGSVPHTENLSLNSGTAFLFPVDACMGVNGFPQSGTGQASIYCGINASELLGMHFGPYPYSTLIPVISEKNIFRWYKDNALRPFFANAYPKVFFEMMAKRSRMMSASTICWTKSGFALNTEEDVKQGKALTAEITGGRWNEKLNYNLSVLSPEDAGRKLLQISGGYDFTLYEYYLTDYAGHGRITPELEKYHHILDGFLYTILTEHPADMTVVICSDHGNYEDVSVKSHTYNPALGIASGKYSDRIASEVKSLFHFKNALTGISAGA